MEKTITKTAKQATLEKKMSEQLESDTCPNCGEKAIFYSYYNQFHFFKHDEVVRNYCCYKCGCEWEVRTKE